MIHRGATLGANGFVGCTVGRELVAPGLDVVGMVRREKARPQLLIRVSAAVARSFTPAGLGPLLHDMDAVVHLVAKTHVASGSRSSAWRKYTEAMLA